MSDPATPVRLRSSTTIRPWIRALGCVPLIVFGLLVFGPLVGGHIEAGFVLVTGWISFLARTVPKIHWNWDLLLMALLCVAFVLLGAQWFLNWLAQTVRAARPETSVWRWPWKWTWCGLAALAVFFLVGMSVGGIVHQVGWLASSPGPIIEEKGSRREMMKLYELEHACVNASAMAAGNLAEMRELLWSKQSGLLPARDVDALQGNYHVLVALSPDGKVCGDIVFPRHPQLRAKMGCRYSIGPEQGAKKGDELTELLSKHRSQLVAL